MTDNMASHAPGAAPLETPIGAHILVVDDEVENRELLATVLRKAAYQVTTAGNGDRALELLRNDHSFSLLITDLVMPGSINGIELLQTARQLRPELGRILVTAFGTVEDTVSAMKAGAVDVLTKPLKTAVILSLVKEVLERVPRPTLNSVSRAYAFTLDRLRKAAASDATVLLTGESGTGKTFLASLLHQWSARSESAFVSVNSASIPKDLMEAELFGVAQGAYTGASKDRMGMIMSADHGTLLLDEIGDLSSELQAKLLQFLQEKRFYRVGSPKEMRADVRVVAATNRDLPNMVSEGRFRNDLYYRLKVIEIPVPSLRERRDDLYWLVPSLLDRLAEKHQRPKCRLSAIAFRDAWNYSWPGNIRELENVLESALVLASDLELKQGLLESLSLPQGGEHAGSAGAIPQSLSPPGSPINRSTQAQIPFEDLASRERKAIQEAMALSGGNKKIAAKLLGISERTLYRVLENKDDHQ